METVLIQGSSIPSARSGGLLRPGLCLSLRCQAVAGVGIARRAMAVRARRRTRLARAAVAWRHGGEAALATLDGAHMPSPEAEAAACHQLRTVRLSERSAPPRIRRTRGRLQLTGEGIELRWGPDERWYPYRKDRGQWWAAGPPAHDAAEALRGTFAAG